MKRISMVSLFCIFLFFTGSAFAQHQEGAAKSESAARGEAAAQAQVKEMTEKLKLTEVQQKKIHAILVNQHQQHEALAKEKSSKTDKMARAHAIHAAAHQKIRATLSVEQRKSFDAMAHGKGNSPATAAHVTKLATTLKLDAAQRTKLKGLMEAQHQQHMAIAKEPISKEEKQKKAASLHADTERQIREMLNENQKKQFDQMEHAKHAGG